jgi:hypothetical protein
MKKQKVDKTRPKFKVQVEKMWRDWYKKEGQKSFDKYWRNHFTLYFEVK